MSSPVIQRQSFSNPATYVEVKDNGVLKKNIEGVASEQYPDVGETCPQRKADLLKIIGNYNKSLSSASKSKRSYFSIMVFGILATITLISTFTALRSQGRIKGGKIIDMRITLLCAKVAVLFVVFPAVGFVKKRQQQRFFQEMVSRQTVVYQQLILEEKADIGNQHVSREAFA